MPQQWFEKHHDVHNFTSYRRTDMDDPELDVGSGEHLVTGLVEVYGPRETTKTNGYYSDRDQPLAEESGQQKMFSHTSEHKNATVSGLFMDKRYGFRDLPAILGTAQFDSIQRYGSRGALHASGDLSEFSAPLVERVKKSGAIPSDSSTDVTNSLDQEESTVDVHHSWSPMGQVSTKGGDQKMVLSGRLDRGKRLAKQVLSTKRESTPEPMKQGELF